MNITFGEYVRYKRIDKKITLRAFAKQINVSPTYISCIENNEKAAPTIEILKNIVKVLDLEGEDKDTLYDLAAKTKVTNPLPLDISETIQKNPTIKIALRVSKNFEATDEEWADFIKRLKEKRCKEGGERYE